MTESTLDELTEELAPLADGFTAAGHRLYLVGGIVRDDLMGHAVEQRDVDLTTDARPDAVKALVAPLAATVWTQGERFGTIGARIGDHTVEITTHRADRYDADSRKPEVDFSDSLDSDLRRRDFTVNAMARELPDGRLCDPLGGRDDLTAGVLRTPIDPHLSFTDDPLRMVRAARFTASHGFTVDPAARQAIVELVDRLDIVAVERVEIELRRLLGAPQAERGLRLAYETGLAGRFLPELDDARLSRLADTPEDALVRLAVVLAPDDPRPRLRALRMANHDVARVARLVTAATAVGPTDDPPVEGLRRLVAMAGSDLDAVLAVADAMGEGGPERRRAVAELVAAEGDDFTPPLDGAEVMRVLDLEPGADVGRALAHLRDVRFRDGPLDRAAAEQELRAWWSG